MKKLLLLLTLASTLITFTSCKKEPEVDLREYCYIDILNTTSDYVIEAKIDGKTIEYYSYGADGYREVILSPGKSLYNIKLSRYTITYACDVTFEYHKVISKNDDGSVTYQKAVEKTIGKIGYQFSSLYDYKFTLRDDGVGVQATASNEF